MRPLSLLAAGLLAAFACSPASLQQLAEALVAPADPTGSPGAWAHADALPEMRWEQVTPSQTPAGLGRSASGNLEGLGKVTIHFIGGPVDVRQASLMLPQGVAMREFGNTLLRLIPLAKVRRFRGDCPGADEAAGSSVYRLDLPGRKHVFAILRSTLRGPSIETELILATHTPADWRCAP